MRLLALGAAIAISTMLSSPVNAADLALPPPAVGQPQYGVAPPPAVSPPQVIIVPGLSAAPSYDGAMIPPRVVGPSPYGVAPSAEYGQPQVYSGRSTYRNKTGSLGPQVYPGPPSQTLSGPVRVARSAGVLWPRRPTDFRPLSRPVRVALPAGVFSGASTISDRYPEQYASPYPQVYSGRGAPPFQTAIRSSTRRPTRRCTLAAAPHRFQTAIPTSTGGPTRRCILAAPPHRFQTAIPVRTSRRRLSSIRHRRAGRH